MPEQAVHAKDQQLLASLKLTALAYCSSIWPFYLAYPVGWAKFHKQS
jgi:uncharacterized protein YbdZ (MbtH family)